MVTEKTYTTFDISKICGVYPTTVANWIDKGSLKAFITPGGHRRVGQVALLKFLKKYNVPAPREIIVPAAGKRKRILVVDDDKLVLEVISKTLSSGPEKYIIKTVTDGFQAGQALIDMNPELVILDIKLPGVNGFEISGIIKSRDSNIKILAVSGYATEEIRKSILSAGADDFLAKPFEIKELRQKARRLLLK
ncbi:MAG: hypothetical protein CVU78_04660 [Elusimicrobia bacterium HGW-Elusimicrobia-2]|nr:MAG: hypothetical protein CVU78_04660 [Elusimicrobia bacterium HGW-Elusimicrobia-2]